MSAEPEADPAGPRGPVQLELELAPPTAGERRRASVRGTAKRAGAALLAWLPAFALLAAFAQIALLGLEPARAESRRLTGQEAVVREREQRLLDAHDALLRQREALADPVFQERVARARRSERFDAPPRPLDLPLAPPVAPIDATAP